MASPSKELKVEGKSIPVSRLEKVFYPKAGFTKGDVLHYYIGIAPVLLPHLKGRAVTLKRYPDGVDGGFFYEKSCPPYRPKWLKTAAVWSKHRGENIHYCVLDNLASLIWAANLADLELHTFLYRVPHVHKPTMLAFDLDPGAPAGLLECVELALEIKRLFAKWKLQCFPKTSGSKGLQVYLPLNTAVSFDQTGAFAKAVAQHFEARWPDKVVSKMTKSLRQGKVFVDWSQNDEHKTTVCAYSLRAKERPTVSTPVKWSELSLALKKGNEKSLFFESEAALRRAKKMGDLFAPVLKLKQKLPKKMSF